jgi:TPR repeat protein
MSRLIQIVAGASAGVLAVALGVAFLPQLEQSVSGGKQAVAKPVFVPLPPPPPVAAAANEPDKNAALVKLAEALKATPGASAPVGTATRALAFAAPDNFKAAPAIAAARPPVSDKARQLCAQGLVALANGDISGARALLMRAADEGDARALMALGETYEPTTLAGLGALGVKGDASRAREYYNKALAAGVGAARERLAALEAD